MINIKIPRQAIYRKFEDDPGACPNCGGELVNENQTYVVATRRKQKVEDKFMVMSDFGWFCKSCLVIVINTNGVKSIMEVGMGIGKLFKFGLEYAVLGIVNLDAVPASKRHLPLGEDNNPIPLIKFKNMDESEEQPLLANPAIHKKVQGKVEEPKPVRRSKHRKRSR